MVIGCCVFGGYDAVKTSPPCNDAKGFIIPTPLILPAVHKYQLTNHQVAVSPTIYSIS